MNWSPPDGVGPDQGRAGLLQVTADGVGWDAGVGGDRGEHRNCPAGTEDTELWDEAELVVAALGTHNSQAAGTEESPLLAGMAE